MSIIPFYCMMRYMDIYKTMNREQQTATVFAMKSSYNEGYRAAKRKYAGRTKEKTESSTNSTSSNYLDEYYK